MAASIKGRWLFISAVSPAIAGIAIPTSLLMAAREPSSVPLCSFGIVEKSTFMKKGSMSA